MYVAVCCDRGSPGATTSSLALASAWPTPVVLVEADPYGGDLAVRLRNQQGSALPESPTLLTVAVAARTDPGADLLVRYGHEFNDVVRVIPGHLVAEQGAALDWESLRRAVSASSTPAVVDLGRIHCASPSLPLAAAADLLMLVCPATLSGLVHLRERLARLIPAVAELRGTPPTVLPLLVAGRRAARQQVQHVHEVLAASPAAPSISQVASLAWDPAGVERLERGESPHGFLRRTALMGSARTVVEQIYTLLPTHAGARPNQAVVQ